ncbi:MAG: hypothetical protein ACR2F6_13910 [Mycobacteriales bacterium]
MISSHGGGASPSCSRIGVLSARESILEHAAARLGRLLGLNVE